MGAARKVIEPRLAEATVAGIGENSVTGFTLKREPLHAVVNTIATASRPQTIHDSESLDGPTDRNLILVIARILHVLWFACQSVQYPIERPGKKESGEVVASPLCLRPSGHRPLSLFDN